MVGDYPLTSHVASDGIRYYESQDSNIPANLQHRNAGVMAQQPKITDFEAQFNGPFPFASDGVVASAVSHGAAIEEMETMIVFTNSYVNKSTLYHENMHQWWGDNVTEGGYDMTFFKEGMATLGQVLAAAQHAQSFEQSLVDWFNRTYGNGDTFWTQAPSQPAPYDLFSGSATYDRPAAAYVALWEILGTVDVHPGVASPATAVRRQQHHRTRARTRLRHLSARADPTLPAAAQRLLHPVVRHRLPIRRRRQPAADHRPRPGRWRLLRRLVPASDGMRGRRR